MAEWYVGSFIPVYSAIGRLGMKDVEVVGAAAQSWCRGPPVERPPERLAGMKLTERVEWGLGAGDSARRFRQVGWGE
jgi:hypothetical protein